MGDLLLVMVSKEPPEAGMESYLSMLCRAPKKELDSFTHITVEYLCRSYGNPQLVDVYPSFICMRGMLSKQKYANSFLN